MQLKEVLDRTHIVSIPTKTNFRGVQFREIALIEGDLNWGEFSPFLEYGAEEAAPWLRNAIESAVTPFQSTGINFIPVNATLPAVPIEQVAEVLSWFPGCNTVKIKVGTKEDLERIREVFRINAAAQVRLDANGLWSVAEAKETGKSILFMLETNPGPGLGILLAFWFAGPRVVRGSVPGAVIIHFFGGIHEIYFPYILMKPRLILAAIAGGAAGVAMNVALSNGLTATPSPGSIFAYMVVTPKGDTFKVLLAIAVSAAVSFVVGWFLLKTDKSNNEDLDSAKARKDSLKNG